jgi:HlyD family secretion protein
MNTRLHWVAAAVVIVGVGCGSAYWLLGGGSEGAGGQIHVSGNIETTEAQVAFKLPGRVEKRLLDEGQMVKQGEPVALLDSAELLGTVNLRRAEVAIAEAALAELLAGTRAEDIAAAKAAKEKAAYALADLVAGSRPQEIASAKAAVGMAEADMKRAKADLHRVEKLAKDKVKSQEELDTAQAMYKMAEEKWNQAMEQEKLTKEGARKGQIDMARAALAQAKAQHELAVAGSRKEDIAQGRAKLEQARVALSLAETQLSYATIVSPLTGVVLSKNIEAGEYVAPGTAVITVGDLVNVWLRAYITADSLSFVKVGQRAWVTVDGRPGKKYEGRVSFISSEAEFTPKNVQTPKERVKLVYRIKINIKNPSMELKPGMPADAVIEAGE